MYVEEHEIEDPFPSWYEQSLITFIIEKIKVLLSMHAFGIKKIDGENYGTNI